MFIDRLQVTFFGMVLESLFEVAPEPPYELIHTRAYDVTAYYIDDSSLMVRGIVHDQKPPGMYLTGDPAPLSIHHMTVDLTIAFPSLEITAVDAKMRVTPHLECTNIEPSYEQLVGLSIARGFSRKVKELFGGPSGCTHIGALLQAMAPVVVQSMWSMRRVASGGSPLAPDTETTREERRAAMAFNLNSCHVWDENGQRAQDALDGKENEDDKPLWIVNRLKALGREPDDWDGW